MNESTTCSTQMLFFLAGGLAGASVALLLAPHRARTPARRCGRRDVKPPTPPGS
jgi:hypothetical protein